MEGLTLDEGLAALETAHRAALHCHGNPIILQHLLEFLKTCRVKIVSFEQMLGRRLEAEGIHGIQAEAYLESLRALSLSSVQLIRHQITAGLCKTLQEWNRSEDLQTIRTEAQKILQRSRIARRILQGVRIVIAGPPNSGKSTLLNRLTGQERAIVSNIPGTTRDWISAFGRIGPLWVEWVDTAGIDEELTRGDTLEQIAQQKSKALLTECDLILYVLDISSPLETNPPPTNSRIPMLTVFNKSDLTGIRPFHYENRIVISALQGTGFEKLYEGILRVLQVSSFSLEEPAAFTKRQLHLLQHIASAQDLPTIKTTIQQLFDAPRPV